jgi:hypothetical protein
MLIILYFFPFLWYHLLISKSFVIWSMAGVKNSSRTLRQAEGNPMFGSIDWHWYCVLQAFSTNKIICLYSRSTPPQNKTRGVDYWISEGRKDDFDLITILELLWTFSGIWPHQSEDTTTNNSTEAHKLDPKVNFWLSFESDHINHLSTMGNFNTSQLATLHSLSKNPLLVDRASIRILVPTTEVQPHFVVAASRDGSCTSRKELWDLDACSGKHSNQTSLHCKDCGPNRSSKVMFVVTSIGRIKGEAEPLLDGLQRSSIVKEPE